MNEPSNNEISEIMESIRFDPRVNEEEVRLLLERVFTPEFSQLIDTVADAYVSSDGKMKVQALAALKKQFVKEGAIFREIEGLDPDNQASLAYEETDSHQGWVVLHSPELAVLDELPEKLYSMALNNLNEAMRDYIHELAAMRILTMENAHNLSQLIDAKALWLEKRRLALGTRRNNPREIVSTPHVIDAILLRRIQGRRDRRD